MGVIQNAINQALGTAALATRLSSRLEAKAKTRAELADLERQEQSIKLQQEALSPMVNVEDYLSEESKEAASLQMKESEQKLSDIKQRQLELKPSKESAAAAVLQRSVARRGTFMTIKEDPEEILREQYDIAEAERAMKKAADIQNTKQSVKRNFKDYVGKLKTSLGGKVGDLPENMQKAIMKQYSTKERKKLMNTIDKEKISDDK